MLRLSILSLVTRRVCAEGVSIVIPLAALRTDSVTTVISYDCPFYAPDFAIIYHAKGPGLCFQGRSAAAVFPGLGVSLQRSQDIHS